MSEILAKTLVYGLTGYAAFGLAFAFPFVCLGVQSVDSEARGSGIGFRLLIIPGVAAFWPTFLLRWIRRVHEPSAEENPHRALSKS